MKKKNIFLLILALLVVFGATGIWWYKNYQAITDPSLASVKKKGVLVVGSDIPYGVMELFDQNNKPVGIDVDIASEIASRLGVKLEFNDYVWDQVFPLVENGKIDLAISSITITPDRQKEMLFSNPYFSGGQVIIVTADNQDIKGVNELANKKIATGKDSTGYNEAQKYTPENLISTYLNYDNSISGQGIISDLKNKKVDAIIVDYIKALSIIKDNPSLKIVGVPFTKEEYGIATKIGNNSLMEKINSILQEMYNDGSLEKIETKWTKI